MHGYQKSIGCRRAKALFASGWWIGRTAREIAKFQLFTVELCVPFPVFHRALEAALRRPVWIHECGFNVDGLIQEFLDEHDPPTFDEVMALLDPSRRLVVAVDDQTG